MVDRCWRINLVNYLLGLLIHMDSHVFTINSNPFQLELIPPNLELIQLQHNHVQ